MKTKRLFALVLALLMLTTMLAGCGEGDAPAAEASEQAGNAAEAKDDLYIIDVLVDTAPISDPINTTIGQYIADKFGIGFKFVTYPGDVKEKQALMLAAGDYNEIQYMQDPVMVQQYTDAGVLINLDDYKELLPDFYERFEDLIPYWRSTAQDGGLYKWECSTPRTAETLVSHNDIVVRSDVLAYYGYPELVTASDWIAFLEQAVKDFPTAYDGTPTVGLTIPMAESYGMQGLVPIGYQKGETYLQIANDYYIYNNKTNQFVDYLLNEETKESFKFFNDLYTKGILDEECFTDGIDMTQAKMNNGSAIATWYVKWCAAPANDALTKAGHPEMSYVEMPFQLDSQEGQKYSTRVTMSYPFMSYGITKNCKDPERVIKFINWCCTEEAQLLMQCGIEGVHYEVVDGKRVATELRKQCSSDADLMSKEGLYDGNAYVFRCLPTIMGPAEDGQPYNLSNEQAYVDEFSLNDTQRQTYEALGWESSNAWWSEHILNIDTGYAASCALDPTSDLGKVGAKMVETRVKYSANLLMADDFEAEWEKLMAEYDKLDHEAVIAAMNENLAAYNN